jgi:hypothetical protein
MTHGAAGWLLAAALVFGLAHVAALPPWEGFDETGHYSYVQQIADGGGLPAPQSARLGQDVEQWSAAARVHEVPKEPRRYVPGATGNWQAQHPPLYYLTLLPVYWATRDWTWGSHLLALRVASYLLAWMGLVIAVVGCLRHEASGENNADVPYWGQWAALGIVVWPFLVPSWFPEMGRLGNDSLGCLLAAIVFVLCAGAAPRGMTPQRALALGVVLGLGCLTKILFVPVALGTLAFWAARRRGRSVRDLALMVVTAGIVGSSWYVGQTVTNDASALALSGLAGSVVASRGESGFAFGEALYAHYHLVEFAVWNGTWSQARPPIWSLVPLVLALVFWAFTLAWGQRRFPADGNASLPLWLGVPFVGALSGYVIVRTALTGQGPYLGGYYIHILAGALGAGLGVGASVGWRYGGFRRLAALLAAYSIAFAAALTWAQLMLFAGIFFLEGPDFGYRMPETLPPFAGVPEAMARLDALAFPRLALGLWLAGAICLAAGLNTLTTWLRSRA